MDMGCYMFRRGDLCLIEGFKLRYYPQHYNTLVSVKLPNTSRIASQISPTVA